MTYIIPNRFFQKALKSCSFFAWVLIIVVSYFKRCEYERAYILKLKTLKLEDGTVTNLYDLEVQHLNLFPEKVLPELQMENYFLRFELFVAEICTPLGIPYFYVCFFLIFVFLTIILFVLYVLYRVLKALHDKGYEGLINLYEEELNEDELREFIYKLKEALEKKDARIAALTRLLEASIKKSKTPPPPPDKTKITHLRKPPRR